MHESNTRRHVHASPFLSLADALFFSFSLSLYISLLLSETLSLSPAKRECIDYKTSMITAQNFLRELVFFQDLGFSFTLGPYTFFKKETSVGQWAPQRTPEWSNSEFPFQIVF